MNTAVLDPEVVRDWREHKQKWLENRIHVANLVRAQSDGIRFATEFDSEILLCCLLGALSAKVWPKQGDAARFVQLLVDYCPVQPDLSTVSIPYLVASLDGQPEQQLVKANLWSLREHQVVAARTVDRSEGTVSKAIPSLNQSIIRRASYAHILYKELRCGLIHEYELGGALTDWNITKATEPTYFWNNQKPVLYLPYNHILEIVRSTAEAVFDQMANNGNFDFSSNTGPTWLGKR